MILKNMNNFKIFGDNFKKGSNIRCEILVLILILGLRISGVDKGRRFQNTQYLLF